jgi:hypothetical protein
VTATDGPAQDRLWGPLVEGHDHVHAAERLQHRDPVRLRNQGTFRALQPAHRVVGVQTHYQTVPQRPRRPQGGHMPGMQQIEAPPGGHHRPSHGPHGRDQAQGPVDRRAAAGGGIARA